MISPTIAAVNNQELNNALKAMIANDSKLVLTDGISPKVWTCTWYNDPTSRRKQKLYKKNDAVWVNTEDPDMFVKNHIPYIRNVVLNNSQLRAEYQRVEGDSAEEFQLFKKVAVGEITGNSDGLPLFYFGNLKDKVKIKISLADENDELPTDTSSKWKDFFKNQDKSEFKNALEDFFQETLSATLNQHLAEYHLSGLTESWIEQYGAPKTLEDFYLLKNLSNVGLFQEYNGSPGEDDKGLDYVLHFYKRSYPTADSVVCKWFKVWKSGYLEHGGIVKPSAASIMEDSLAYGDQFYKVNLNWTSSGSSKAPAYRYPIRSDGFYIEAEKIDLGGTSSFELEQLGYNVDSMNRYCVQVTPIMNQDDKTPYQTMHPSSPIANGAYYLAKDIVSITNSSFCFLLDPDVTYYSYYTSGFASNVQQGF